MTLTEILKAKGISDDIVKAVLEDMKANKIFTSAEENIDIRYGKLKTEHEAVVKERDEGKALIESLQKSNKGNEALQSQISDYQTKMEQLQAELQQTKIDSAINVGLLAAGVKPEDITAFAGTVGPGLVGCLLVGLNATKTLALDIPAIIINRVDIKSLSSWCQIEFANEGANPISHGAKLYINGCELNDLIIPENISQIKNYAFAGCLSLKNINITNNIISIGKRAFWKCRNLESTVINKNVKALGELAFQECSGTLYIDCDILDARINNYYICFSEGEWYEYGCNGPFYECWGPLVDNNFSEILLGSNARYIGDGAFCRSNKLERLVIPEGIKSIKSNTFSSCSCLKQIVIPKSVTKIEDYAFSDCQSLVEITIPEGIVKIEDSTFLNCKSLKSLEIPDSVTEIGPDVFYGCESLVFVKLGESLSYIDLNNDPFWGCNSLESVYLSSKCMARVKQHMENVMITEEDMEYCHRWYKLLVVDDDMMQDILDVKNNTTNNPVVEMINGMEVRLGTKVGQGVVIGKSPIMKKPKTDE